MKNVTLKTIAQETLKMIETLINVDEINVDELGRLIINDASLLEKINGASFTPPGFMQCDGACGNTNCVC